MDEILNPGSPEAFSNGCTCPIRLNAGGDGVDVGDLGTAFLVYEFCPLHGKQEKVTP